MYFDIPPLQNQIFTQRAEKAFSFIQQAVNLLGKVGTSPFFHAPRYSALAESNLYQRAVKAFQFIRQVVNLLDDVGTSLFFCAPYYFVLADRMTLFRQGSLKALQNLAFQFIRQAKAMISPRTKGNVWLDDFAMKVRTAGAEQAMLSGNLCIPRHFFRRMRAVIGFNAPQASLAERG